MAELTLLTLMGPAKDETATSSTRTRTLTLTHTHTHTRCQQGDRAVSLGAFPVTVADADTQEDAAKPGEVLKDLLLRVPANIQARAHKHRRNRRMYLGLMCSVLPEHPQYALVVRRCILQHQ